jgi:tetratricopeptide (TPR) repeat protein
MPSRFPFLILAFCSLLLLPIAKAQVTSGEVRTIRKEVRQVMGSNLSQDDAETLAIARAKREAVEEAGTYLETLSVVRNANLERDDILALSSGVLEVKIVEKRPFVENHVFGIVLMTEITVDSATLDSRIQRLLRDPTGIRQLTATRDQQQAALQANDPLKSEALAWFILSKSSTLSDNRSDLINAVQYANNAIYLEPSYADAYFQRGYLQYRLNNYDLAIKDYTHALALNPPQWLVAQLYFQRAVSYSFMKDFDKAIKDIESAASLNPKSAQITKVSAIFSARKGDHKRAISLYSEAIEAAPHDQMLYNYRASSFEAIKNFDAAIADYSTAIRIDDRYYDAIVSRGNAYRSQRRTEKAENDFSTAIQLDPNNDAAYYYRGTFYLDQNHLEEATRDLSQAILLNPKNANAYNNRGFAHSKLGRLEDAIADYTKAIATSGGSDQTVFNRAQAFFESGRFDEAIGDFSRLANSDDFDYKIAGIFGIAGSLYSQGTYNEARIQYDLLIAESEPRLPQKLDFLLLGYFGKGNCAYWTTGVEAAIAQYDLALDVFDATSWNIMDENPRAGLTSVLRQAQEGVEIALKEQGEMPELKRLLQRLGRAVCRSNREC